METLANRIQFDTDGELTTDTYLEFEYPLLSEIKKGLSRSDLKNKLENYINRNFDVMHCNVSTKPYGKSLEITFHFDYNVGEFDIYDFNKALEIYLIKHIYNF